MISCTDFIPSYSELFTYLEEKNGRQEVERFWKYLFQPDGKGIPLVNFVKEHGIRGCFLYWTGTLNEEAADFTMYLNEKAGWFALKMHRCPSKGRLLQLKEEIGLTPYHDYCLHCDNYRQAVAKVGLEYIYDFIGTNHASCSLLIYDPKIFDGRVIVDENTEIMDRKAADNEYFHRDFHSSMNMGIEYLGQNYGEDDIRAYLTRFTLGVYGRAMERIKDGGLDALAEFIKDTYRREHAGDALSMTQTENCLEVKIAYCPAVEHLHTTGREVTRWYDMTTTVPMEVIAKECGLTFTMESYDQETGAAKFRFERG